MKTAMRFLLVGLNLLLTFSLLEYFDCKLDRSTKSLLVGGVVLVSYILIDVCIALKRKNM